MCELDFTADEKTIIRAAVEEMYSKYIEPYRRKPGVPDSNLPTPSSEMMQFIRKVDRLAIKIRTNMWC